MHTPLGDQPGPRHSRCKHERAVLFPVVGDQVERGAHEIGAAPRVRKVADESLGRRIVPDDLGPLPPRRWCAVIEEESEQVLGAVSPTEPYERPDVAHLIGGERLPGLAVAPLSEELPVSLERALQGSRRGDRGRSAGGEGDRGGGGVEVAQVRAARDIVDVMRAQGRGQRGPQVACELVAVFGQTVRVRSQPQLPGEKRGVPQPAQGEEIVPVALPSIPRG